MEKKPCVPDGPKSCVQYSTAFKLQFLLLSRAKDGYTIPDQDRVEACFLLHYLIFHQLLPGLAGNQPNPALLVTGLSEDAFGPLYRGPACLVVSINWPEPLLGLLLLSIMQQRLQTFANPNKQAKPQQTERIINHTGKRERPGIGFKLFRNGLLFHDSEL